MSTVQFSSSQAIETANPAVSWLGLLRFEKTFFVSVNVMDMLMTYLLLSTGSFYESNPIANYILTGWGLLGMFAFKLIIVAFVMLIANIVSIWRIGTARNLLYFGSFIIGSVVAYSVFLMMNFKGFI